MASLLHKGIAAKKIASPKRKHKSSVRNIALQKPKGHASPKKLTLSKLASPKDHVSPRKNDKLIKILKIKSNPSKNATQFLKHPKTHITKLNLRPIKWKILKDVITIPDKNIKIEPYFKEYYKNQDKYLKEHEFPKNVTNQKGGNILNLKIEPPELASVNQVYKLILTMTPDLKGIVPHKQTFYLKTFEYNGSLNYNALKKQIADIVQPMKNGMSLNNIKNMTNYLLQNDGLYEGLYYHYINYLIDADANFKAILSEMKARKYGGSNAEIEKIKREAFNRAYDDVNAVKIAGMGCYVCGFDKNEEIVFDVQDTTTHTKQPLRIYANARDEILKGKHPNKTYVYVVTESNDNNMPIRLYIDKELNKLNFGLTNNFLIAQARQKHKNLIIDNAYRMVNNAYSIFKFTHNDAHLGNILVNKENLKITLFDFDRSDIGGKINSGLSIPRYISTANSLKLRHYLLCIDLILYVVGLNSDLLANDTIRKINQRPNVQFNQFLLKETDRIEWKSLMHAFDIYRIIFESDAILGGEFCARSPFYNINANWKCIFNHKPEIIPREGDGINHNAIKQSHCQRYAIPYNAGINIEKYYENAYKTNGSFFRKFIDTIYLSHIKPSMLPVVTTIITTGNMSISTLADSLDKTIANTPSYNSKKNKMSINTDGDANTNAMSI